MMQLRLPLPPYAYRFELLLAFARRIAHPARMLVIGDTLWRFTAGHLCAYRQVEDAIELRVQDLPKADLARVAAASRRVLGLDQDLSRFYAMAKADSALWNAIAPLHGMPAFCSETMFEALITLIIEQHISWKAALRAQLCLLELLGEPADVAGQTVYDFPGPDTIAHAEPASLKPLKITNRRIDLIISTAAAVASGELELEAISQLPPDRAYQALLALKGVGPWTAGNAIGRACAVYPHASYNDVALQAAVQRYFFAGGGQKGAEQVGDALDRYGEFAGLAGHFVLLRWVIDNYPVVS